MRIYLLMAHPDRDSFDGAIANTYQAAALAAGHQLERQDLASMDFDPILHHGYKTIQPLEPDLVHAQELIAWCERWVIVYPAWWGSVPASDAPNIWTWLAYHNSDVRTVKHAVLQFCGVKPVQVTRFAEIKSSTEAQRAAYLEKVRVMAARIR